MQRNIIDATWIVRANASRARFFAEPAPAEKLQEIDDMVIRGYLCINAEVDIARIKMLLK